jgi:hypothetical protein
MHSPNEPTLQDSARPLIFIAHSFGGLPVIHVLRSSFDNPTTWGNPFQSTAGLLFFGVPFRGREGHPIKVWIDKIAAAHQEDPTFQMWPETMSTAVPEGQYLQELVNRYQETRDCEHPVPVCCFYETEPSPVGKIWDGRNPEKVSRFPCLYNSPYILTLVDSTSSFPNHRPVWISQKESVDIRYRGIIIIYRSSRVPKTQHGRLWH